MSDQLTVSTGGQTSVSTEELFGFSAQLSALATDARDWAHQAAMARSLTEWSADARPYGFAEPALHRTTGSLREVADSAERLSTSVQQVAHSYADQEARTRETLGALQAFAGFIFGTYLRSLVVGAVPFLPAFAVTALLLQQPPLRRAVAMLGSGVATQLAEHPQLIANPAFVKAVRGVVSAADDILAGFSGTSLPIARFLGDEGIGLVGLETVASAAILLGGKHAYTATPVRTTPAGDPRTVPPPASLADAARRIPSTGAGKPQVTVERYPDGSGGRSYAVYVAGTTDFGPESSEPFDMASNLAALADGDAGSYTATLDAMEQAGVTPGDAVHLFGHSQGGLVAARVAASGVYDTQTLVTFGSPSGQVPVPESVTQVAVEHADDLVPALGGAPIDGADGRDRVVVSRSVFGDSGPRPDNVAAAHFMTEYERTAALIDNSSDPRLSVMTDSLAGIGAGAGVAQAFRAERVRPG
ncbi:hypothetical protein L1277_001362 [Okibacterium sp. HSC-33S16]|uniref:hypothetical protein n=1 Tax=Okibacterium sp. HSC-33S16 TaxID=2910965 RepID=UPI00209E295E|nr:hypothetical protein [Okibacterium sp. HSC-33S16]MCP2031271.1 hypothetical protein [Okibacterium sp. HSC-33S16]